jgi:hypothetical protein
MPTTLIPDPTMSSFGSANFAYMIGKGSWDIVRSIKGQNVALPYADPAERTNFTILEAVKKGVPLSRLFPDWEKWCNDAPPYWHGPK